MLQSQWTKVDDDAGERYALWSTLLHLGVESLTVGVESCEEPVPIGDARSWKVLAGHRWVGLRNMPKIYFH